MRIDAHQHFWNYDPIKHFWINDEMKVIKRDFSPGDLAPLLKELKFDGTITSRQLLAGLICAMKRLKTNWWCSNPTRNSQVFDASCKGQKTMPT